MKEYLLYFFLIKFLFLLTSVNGFDRINRGFNRLTASLRRRQQEAGAQEEGTVEGIERVEMMDIGNNNQEACKDFYSHVCNLRDGNNQTLVDILKNEELIEIYNIRSTTAILEEPDRGPRYDKLSMEKAWHKACIDRRFSRQAGLHFLSTIINETEGIRNINNTQEPQGERKNWRAVASAYARRFGESALFKFSINEQKLISIYRPTQWNLDILSDDDLNNKIDLLFDNFSFDRIEDLTGAKNELFDFIKSMTSYLKRLYLDVNIFTIEKLQQDWSFINLTSFLQDVGLNLNKLDKVEIEPLYLAFLYRLLNNSSDNNIVNYIHWLYATSDKVQLYWDTSLNSLDNFELSALCFKHMPIKEEIGSIIGKTNLMDRKALIRELFENVREAFIREVHLSWLTNNTKDETLEKLRNVKLTLTNKQHRFSLDVSYTFDINFCSLENLMNFNRAQMVYLLAIFRENQPKLEFDLISRTKRALRVNVKADKDVNEIKISATELMTPLFNNLQPTAWNYGNVATSVSFKLTEILHKSIRKIPGNQMLIFNYYWKRKCFVKSFLKHSNFDQTDQWSLIDKCFALKMSYNALNNALKSQTIGGNQILPIFQGLSERQLFFTSFVADKCQNSLYKNEANEAMRNLKGFAQAFKCEPKSFMNPVKKM